MTLPETTEQDQRMSEDFAWAENAAEVQQHPDHFGKLVVVYNKRVVGVEEIVKLSSNKPPRKPVYPDSLS